MKTHIEVTELTKKELYFLIYLMSHKNDDFDFWIEQSYDEYEPSDYKRNKIENEMVDILFNNGHINVTDLRGSECGINKNEDIKRIKKGNLPAKIDVIRSIRKGDYPVITYQLTLNDILKGISKNENAFRIANKFLEYNCDFTLDETLDEVNQLIQYILFGEIVY